MSKREKEGALQDASKQTVAQISEICNVPEDDAFRVLQKCDFDMQVAIDRFLSGQEGEWSEVSRRKKPEKKQANAGRSTGGARHGGSGHERDRDRSGGHHSTASAGTAREQRSGHSGARGRGRRPKGGQARGDKDSGHGRRQPEWSSTNNKEKLPDWAKPENTPQKPGSKEGLKSEWVPGQTVERESVGGWGSSNAPIESTTGWSTTDPSQNATTGWGQTDAVAGNKSGWGAESKAESASGWTESNADGGWGSRDIAKPTAAWGGVDDKASQNASPATASFPEDRGEKRSDAAISGGAPPLASDLPKPKLNFAEVVSGAKQQKQAQPAAEVKSATAATATAATALAAPPGISPLPGAATKDQQETAPEVDIEIEKKLKPLEPMKELEPMKDLEVLDAPLEPPDQMTRDTEPAAPNDGLLAAWTPNAESAAAEQKKPVELGGSGERGVPDVKLAMKSGIPSIGVDQLGLQFGSFGLDGDTRDAAKEPSVSEIDWRKEGATAGPVGSAASAPGIPPGQTRNYDPLSMQSGAKTSAQTQGSVQSSAGERSGPGAPGYLHGSGYPMQPPHPHQQYPMIPMPYPYDGQQAGARGGMQSGHMQSYYDPQMMNVMPTSQYRDSKHGGSMGSNAGNVGGHGNNNKQAGGRGPGGNDRGMVQGMHDNSGMNQQLNPYMMAQGFTPYPSMYAFPHNPYGGVGQPHHAYPQYAPAGEGPNRGSSRGGMEGFDEGGFGQPNTNAPDSHLYGPPQMTYLGMPPMMPDMHQQMPGREKGADNYKGGQGPGSHPQAGMMYPPEYGSQNPAWSGQQGRSGQHREGLEQGGQASQPGAKQVQSMAPQPGQQPVHGHVQGQIHGQVHGQHPNPGQMGQHGDLTHRQQGNSQNYYSQAPSGGQYPFFQTYYYGSMREES